MEKQIYSSPTAWAMTMDLCPLLCNSSVIDQGNHESYEYVEWK